jgi:acetate---CoA ligase (ADP-forming)
MTKDRGLGALLNPSSVAILGASDTPTRIGGRTLAYMLARPFAGRIHPVNPNRKTVQGLNSYSCVADLPEAPDVAIVALAADLVPGAIDDLVARGARSAIIFSSGFAEVDAAGAARQALLVEKARAGGLRLLGPNTLGAINTRVNFWGTFTSTLESGWPETGRIGIASQSGAYGTHMLAAAMMRGLGVSAFVATGNEADITTADAIDWMAHHEGTDVIVAYLEGVRDGGRLVSALQAARAARKPVIVMKAGRSALGSAAAQSHTASLAGNDAVADAVLRELGALRIDSTQQALDFAEAAEKRIYPAGNTLGVLTVSGGAGVLIADDCERLGLPMPEMPAAAQAQMSSLLSFAATRNPVDCTAQALNQLDLVGKFGLSMVHDGGYKSLLVFFSQAGGAKSIVPGLRAELRRIREAAPDRLCVLSVLGPPETVRLYQDDGFLVFEDPARAVAAIAAMGRLGDAFAAETAEPRRPKTAPAGQLSRTPNEAEAKRRLAASGIAIAEEVLVTSAAQARQAAEAIGLPVVMKIVSADIAHKTEIGGVITGIGSADEAEAAYSVLMRRGAEARPDAALDGVLVARQIEGGVECIMGVMRDPVFGPVAMFGLGGIHVEVLKDVVLRRCPFDADEAARLIGSIRGFPLLKGVRGRPGVDLDALATMLSRLSWAAVELGDNLVSIDLNPVIARRDGAWAVDAVIEIDPLAGLQTHAGDINGPSQLHPALAVRRG